MGCCRHMTGSSIVAFLAVSSATLACPIQQLHAAVQPCQAACTDGPTIIKRSQRLSWLAIQSDVELRARAFFSPASCFHCLLGLELPAACNDSSISVSMFRNAIRYYDNVKLDSDLSFLANIVERRSAHLFYTMQCTNQCAARPSKECYCRACASLPEWRTFAAFCQRFMPSDLAECQQLSPFLEADCNAGSSSGHYNNGPDAIHEGNVYAEGASLADAPVVHCRTAFNTSCCPAPSLVLGGLHEHAGNQNPAGGVPTTGTGTGASPIPCGGRGRGVCVPIDAWLRAQLTRQHLHQDDHQSCYWPRSYGAARCLCEPRFAGADCGGCARGLSGPNCTQARAFETRRSFRDVSYEEATRWSVLIGRMLHTSPSTVSFAPENEVCYASHTT